MPRRTLLRVDVSAVAPPGCRTLAVDVIAPDEPAAAPGAVFCFAGGGMSRRYFDVPVPGYSFAEYACANGYVVILVDHPGGGDSDAPDDGWTLTPSVIARVDAAAVRQVLDLLRAGAVAGLRPHEPRVVLGVGHSMGAGLLIHQQAAEPAFTAIALLGWSAAGLPEQLGAEERTLASLPGPIEPRLVELARRHNAEPRPVLRRGGSVRLTGNPLPLDVRAAMAGLASPLLAVAGWASMVPGSARRASAEIDVPVFVGVGDRDIARDHHAIPAEFPASRDVTLFVLPDSGHNHNTEPRRAQLWSRILGWAGSLPAAGCRVNS